MLGIKATQSRNDQVFFSKDVVGNVDYVPLNADTLGGLSAGQYVHVKEITVPAGQLLGDFDKDGIITVADRDAINEILSSPSTATEDLIKVGDIDKSGKIESTDVLKIRRAAAGYLILPKEDVLGNWTYDESKDLFVTTIVDSDINPMKRIIVNPIHNLDLRRVAIKEGACWLYVNKLPKTEVKILLYISDGDGTSVTKGLISNDDNKANKSVNYSIEISEIRWTGDEAPYSCELHIPGITKTNNIEVTVPSLTVKQVETFVNAMIMCGEQDDNKLILKAYGDKPEIDLPIEVIVRGDL